MSTQRHRYTPGPWSAQGGTIRDSHMALIGMATEHFADEPTDVEVIHANAQLMATAPQLLQALYRLTHPMADEGDLEYALEVLDRATCPTQTAQTTEGESNE
jgi:hypothetical protein